MQSPEVNELCPFINTTLEMLFRSTAHSGSQFHARTFSSSIQMGVGLSSKELDI